MTQKRKLWIVVIAAVAFGCSAEVFSDARGAARAQDSPQQTLTTAEAETNALLASILAQLIEINRNIQRLPAPPTP